VTAVKRSRAGELARQACIDFPEASTRTLADRLLKRHPNVFCSYETARRMVRYYRGESGVYNRVEAITIPTTKPRVFQAPPSDAEPPVAYRLNVTGQGLLVSDIHVPYHDQKALETAVNYAISHNCTDYIVLLGDIIDHYQLSRYSHDPESRSFAGELEMLRKLLGDLGQVFGKVVYKEGNHERRYIEYMRQRAPALIGVPSFDFKALAGLDEIEADYVPWNAVIHVGDWLTMVHGHEFGGSVFSPVNPARGLFLRAKACGVCGHHHQSSQHDEPDVRGRSMTTWSLGCLCDLHPEYLPFNRWNHGFAEFAYNGGDDWSIQNHRIVKGKVR
jgi:predicted phosphodiesterase